MGDIYCYAVLKEEGGGGRGRDQNIPFLLPLLQLHRSPNININAYYVSPTNMFSSPCSKRCALCL